MNGIQGLGVNQMSFRGNAGAKAADEAAKKAGKFIADEASKAVNGELPKGLKKVCKFLSDNDGEVQNQVINAVFTTTLAPLMIWKNPFSKKSEKDKAYSALRQPISAAIAVSGGLAGTLAVNKALDKLSNEGYIALANPHNNSEIFYISEIYAKLLFHSVSWVE